MTGQSPPKEKEQPAVSAKKRPSVIKDILSLFLKVGSILVIFVLLFTFLYGVIPYDEPGMAPAIKDGDLVFFYRYNNVGYLPQDVIVLERDGGRIARRVVATAGDTVDITPEGLVINGALQQESEVFYKTDRYEEGVSFPLTVPEGQVFVLGDFRVAASDSRMFGCVSVDDTLGKVMAVVRRRNM